MNGLNESELDGRDDRIVVGVVDARGLVCDCPESVRQQDIIDSQHRPQVCECRSESVTGLPEGVFAPFCHTVICV